MAPPTHDWPCTSSWPTKVTITTSPTGCRKTCNSRRGIVSDPTRIGPQSVRDLPAAYDAAIASRRWQSPRPVQRPTCKMVSVVGNCWARLVIVLSLPDRPHCVEETYHVHF